MKLIIGLGFLVFLISNPAHADAVAYQATTETYKVSPSLFDYTCVVNKMKFGPTTISTQMEVSPSHLRLLQKRAHESDSVKFDAGRWTAPENPNFFGFTGCDDPHPENFGSNFSSMTLREFFKVSLRESSDPVFKCDIVFDKGVEMVALDAGTGQAYENMGRLNPNLDFSTYEKCSKLSAADKARIADDIAQFTKAP